MCDEDYVRPDAMQNVVHLQPERLSTHQRPQRGAAPAPTQPQSSSLQGGGSPFKTGPGGTHHSGQTAGVLAEQAAMLLQQQGRLHDAEALLHLALKKCPLTNQGGCDSF